MEQFRVTYETQVITANAVIRPKGFSSVSFRNIGDTDVTILNDIPVAGHVTGSAYFDEYFLINRPGEIVQSDIPVQFATPVTTTKLLVIKTYYEPVILSKAQKEQQHIKEVRTDFIEYPTK